MVLTVHLHKLYLLKQTIIKQKHCKQDVCQAVSQREVDNKAAAGFIRSLPNSLLSSSQEESKHPCDTTPY